MWLKFLVSGKGVSKIEELRAVEIREGLKIKCKEDLLNLLKNDPYIIMNFVLNIKRLNRWWYSVYFKNKWLDGELNERE